MKSNFLIVCALLFFSMSYGQTDTATVAENRADPPKASFTIGAVYADNANYYGQKSQEKTPYVAVVANYKLKSGFYISGLAYKLLNDSTSAISATNIGAGFNFNISKRLVADVSYNHSFYQKNSPLLQASNADNANLTLNYTNWLNVKLAADYAFGKSDDVFTTGGISKNLNLFSISKKDIVTLHPSVDVVAGTQHFYQTYVQQQKLRDSLLGIIPILGGGNNPPPTTTTVKNTSFDIISYNFNIPLAYNRSRYLIEVAYQISFLSKYAQTDAGKTNSFGTLSFYYQF